MAESLNKQKIAWFLLAFLSLTAALIGVINPEIYSSVVAPQALPGTISQDITTLAASIAIIILTLKTRSGDFIKQIIILGLIAYLFYAYGIYVIERMYNVFYFNYMAVFGLSFYTMIYGIANISKESFKKVTLPAGVRNISIGFSFFMPVVFYPLWILQILPLIQTGQKPETFYSIYILDLCFIMPAFIVIAVKTVKKEILGLLLTPALFILGFTLLLPVGIGEFLKPWYSLPIDAAGVLLYLGLSLLFLVLAILHLWKLKIER